jgi:periplasmic divalent cation tolerance protein
MPVIVLVTCPDEKCADKITDSVLEGKLAACVNRIPGIESKYLWKGKTESGRESLLIIKTRENLVNKIEEAVKENHPYDVPEIIALPITAGSKAYLDWIESETG